MQNANYDLVIESAADAIKAVKNPGNIYELARGLNALSASFDSDDLDKEAAFSIAGIDICDLPTFGGSDPQVHGAFSWSDTHVLVCDSNGEFDVIDR